MVSSFFVQQPPAKPAFIYDGECGFCGHWVAHWRNLTEGRVDFIPSVQSPYAEIPSEDYGRSSQFVDTDGKVYSGAEAVFRMFAYAHGKCWWLRAYRHVRGFEGATEFVYRQVATNRLLISRIQRLFLGGEALQYAGTRALFLRLLGLVYLCAFASLLPQVRGLFGEQGILPAADLMSVAADQLAGSARWRALPTLSWFSAADNFLVGQCGAGVLLAALLMLGLFPALMVPALWLLWLSLTVAGRDFMAFQWENLLLEAGFLAIFLAPVSRWLGRGERPSLFVIFLFRWLLFRLMFMSGMVKLLSGDLSWRYFTALFYHFETQPLPTALGWQVYQLQPWTLVFLTGVMYLVEIGFAFLIFGRRKLRIAAFFGFLIFQLGIAATGNYGYFNLLTIALGVFLLDDRFLRFRPPDALPLHFFRNSILAARTFIFALVAVVLLLVSTMQLLSGLNLKRNWSSPMLSLYVSIAPFRLVNSYGLFAVMTKSRTEITIQGSEDGHTWKDYRFKFKPGPLDELPGFIAPHQPRLDWQMWFAALGSYEQNRWFVDFCVRLLQGSAPVQSLLGENPFPAGPPKFIRALAHDYEFTTRSQRRTNANYWVRQNEREYLPSVSLGPVRESEP